MGDNKRLKDSIYGYIYIPIEFMKSVIDTAVFQRLRRILQTSYAPLYSSAIHNRFAHSIEHLNSRNTLETEEDSRRLGQLIRDIYKDLGYGFRRSVTISTSPF